MPENEEAIHGDMISIVAHSNAYNVPVQMKALLVYHSVGSVGLGTLHWA